MSFDLNSPSLAQYHWGTLFCRFSPAAPVQRGTFIRIISSLAAERAPWSDDAECHAAIAFLHELVHLAQDLTTGLGHSDYLTHHTGTHLLLRYMPIVLRTEGWDTRPPYRQPANCSWLNGQEDTFVAGVRDQLRYYPFAMTPRSRREAIRTLLQNGLKNSIEDQDVFEWSVQSLLEGDAMLSVKQTLRRLQATDTQREIYERNTALVDEDKLGPEYSQTVVQVAGIIDHHVSPSEKDLMAVIPRFFGLLVDSAVACPPLDWIETRNQKMEQYEPSVKAVRLMLAFQQLKGSEIDGFWTAMAENRYLDLETILLRHTSFAYPSSTEIYEAWIKALEPRAKEEITAEIRSGACRFRLDNGVLLPYRGIDLLFSMKAPILYLQSHGGFVKHDWGLRIFDREKDHELTQELVDQFMIMELAEFLFRTGEFRCPHAQAGICPAVEDGCVAGFTHLAQFPSSADCRARSVLNSCGAITPASGTKPEAGIDN
jgi:hypothetical protein